MGTGVHHLRKVQEDKGTRYRRKLRDSTRHVHSHSLCRRPPVCRLDACRNVCNVRAPYTQTIKIFGIVSMPWPSVDIQIKCQFSQI